MKRIIEEEEEGRCEKWFIELWRQEEMKAASQRRTGKKRKKEKKKKEIQGSGRVS